MSLAVVKFHPSHIVAFDPGADEAPLFYAIGRDAVAGYMAEMPTLTALRGAYVEGFVGVRNDQEGRLCMWSMWSTHARARPLGFVRLIARNMRRWFDEYGVEQALAPVEDARQEKLARWLGLVPVNGRKVFALCPS